MGTINKDELLKDVRKIINESIQAKPTVYDVTNKFNIHRYVTGLIEEGHKNPKLMNMLVRYDNALTNGAKDFMIFEQFGNDLAKFAKGNRNIKKIIKEMNETLREDSLALTGYQLIEDIDDPYIKGIVTDAFTNYVTNPDSDTLNVFIDSLDMVRDINEPLALQLNLLITKDTEMSDRFIHDDYVDEEQYDELNAKLQLERERRLSDDIYAKVEKYLADTLDAQQAEEEAEAESLTLESLANNQGLNLGEHLAKIANSEAKSNERLMAVVEAYQEAVVMGAYEERLYETLVQNISKYSYLIPVENAIKAINEKANEKHEEITLTKILEEMKDNQYSFIYVDLIQEDVARYVKNPTPTNRVQLRNALAPYAADPYINEMFNVLYNDNTKRHQELAEKALNIKEQINIIRENASVEPIYTPVQYIKENECVFNVNGQYYIKKGNNIAILEDKYVDQLDESFVELCHLVNDPHVEINEDYIEVYGSNNMYAKVFEGYVDVLNVRESRESLRDLRSMCIKHDNYDTNFYIMCSCLLENFNNIAKIDWAKHITLNENNNINVDLFKIDNNIFITTHNDTLGVHTFYRNVNPIFCKNKINEHMGINISSLFSDLLPNQDKIILKLNETKSSYEESIEKYEEMIDKLKEAEKAASDENKKEIQTAIEDAESKLDDIKDEYKKWLKETAEATGTDDETDDSEDKSDDETGTDTEANTDNDSEDNVIKEPSNEPVSDKDVEDNYDELTTPIDNYNDEETTESGVSDEEFDSFMNGDSEDDDFMTDDSDDMDDAFGDDDEDSTEVVVDDSGDDTDTFDDEEINVSDDDEERDTEEFKTITFDDDKADDEVGIDSDDDDILDITADTVDDDSDEDFDIGMDDEMDDMTDDDEYDGDAATDMFGGDTEDPLDSKFDKPERLPANAPDVEGEESNTAPDFAYKIANVMFDENLKTGETSKSGAVVALVPMVSGDGTSFVENKTIKFYIDDDSNVILNNEEMSADLYNAVINAIKTHPSFESVCQTGISPTETEDTEDDHKLQLKSIDTYNDDEDEELSWEEEYYRDGNSEDRRRFALNAEDDDDEWNYINKVLDYSDDEDDTVDSHADSSFSMDEEDDEDIIIPTYKSGNTEIELPSPMADDTYIPESKKTDKKKKPLKEGISITAVYKKGNKTRFFVNEATAIASKKQSKVLNNIKKDSIKNVKVSGNVNKKPILEYTENNPIENYDAEMESALMGKLHNYAHELFQDIKNSGFNVGTISDIKIYGDDRDNDYIEYFDIEGDLQSLELGSYEAYRVFRHDTTIYYISMDDVIGIMDDNRFADKTYIIKELIKNAEVVSDIDDEENCMFMIESIVLSMYNYSTVNENCKIRRKTKLQADNDVDLSKTAHDAKYGTKEENDFKQELEDKQKKDGTIGALDPAQEESVKPKLPNVNLITEKKNEIIYEVNDPVIYEDEIWHVYAIDESDVDDDLTLHITKNGATATVKPKDVEPEPSMLKNLENDVTYDDSDNISRMITKQDLKDLNKCTIECNIVVDGYIVNDTPMKASLNDIVECNEYISVENADGDQSKCHIDSLSFEEENWPYAVIVSTDDEPVRKIRVNPTSYINAGDDDMVEITVADKLTTLPKSSIRILS